MTFGSLTRVLWSWMLRARSPKWESIRELTSVGNQKFRPNFNLIGNTCVREGLISVGGRKERRSVSPSTPLQSIRTAIKSVQGTTTDLISFVLSMPECSFIRLLFSSPLVTTRLRNLQYKRCERGEEGTCPISEIASWMHLHVNDVFIVLACNFKNPPKAEPPYHMQTDSFQSSSY